MSDPKELWDAFPLESTPDPTPTYDFNITVATATPQPANAGTPDSGFEIWIPLFIVGIIALISATIWIRTRIEERKPFEYALLDAQLPSRRSMSEMSERGQSIPRQPPDQALTVLLQVTVPNVIAIGPVLAAMIDAGAESVKLEMSRHT